MCPNTNGTIVDKMFISGMRVRFLSILRRSDGIWYWVSVIRKSGMFSPGDNLLIPRRNFLLD